MRQVFTNWSQSNFSHSSGPRSWLLVGYLDSFIHTPLFPIVLIPFSIRYIAHAKWPHSTFSRSSSPWLTEQSRAETSRAEQNCHTQNRPLLRRGRLKIPHLDKCHKLTQLQWCIWVFYTWSIILIQLIYKLPQWKAPPHIWSSHHHKCGVNAATYDTVSVDVYKFVSKGSKLKVFIIDIKFDENDFLLIIIWYFDEKMQQKNFYTPFYPFLHIYI